MIKLRSYVIVIFRCLVQSDRVCMYEWTYDSLHVHIPVHLIIARRLGLPVSFHNMLYTAAVYGKSACIINFNITH